MIKKIKKYGSTYLITLNKDELKAHNIKENDFVEVYIYTNLNQNGGKK